MDIGTGCLWFVMLFCVGFSQIIPFGIIVRFTEHAAVSGIYCLNRIAVFREKPDFGNVWLHSEGMAVNYHSPVGMDNFKLFLNCAVPNLRMGKKPFLGKTVDQKLSSIITRFPSEENLKTDFIPFLFCIFISLTEAFNPVTPGKGSVNAGITVDKMIRNYDTGVSRCLAGSGHLRSGAAGTG